MPSAKTHEQATNLVAVIIVCGMIFSKTNGYDHAFVVGMGILLGGYFLSPDLDIRSAAYRRWGVLRWIWKPYRKLFFHRSFWSHTPIIGTIIRLTWIAPLFIPILIWSNPNWIDVVAIVAGIEISAIAHWLMDSV